MNLSSDLRINRYIRIHEHVLAQNEHLARTLDINCQGSIGIVAETVSGLNAAHK